MGNLVINSLNIFLTKKLFIEDWGDNDDLYGNSNSIHLFSMVVYISITANISRQLAGFVRRSLYVIVLDPSIIIGNRLFKNNYYPILQKEIEAKRD